MDEKRNEIEGNQEVVGSLCIKFHGRYCELFGAITSGIKTRISQLFQVNIFYW
jgi:hypothetical protein